MEILTPISIRAEAGLMVVFTDFRFVILIEGFLGSQFFLSMSKATITPPFALPIGFKVLANLSLVFARILKVFQFLSRKTARFRIY